MKVALLSLFTDLSSIGIRTISAYLKTQGIATRLLFLPLQKSFYSREPYACYSESVIDQIAEVLKDDDLIGISLMSNFYETAKDLTVKLRKRLPGKKILWGGIHPTVMPEQCINVADFVCIGEGEIPCLELSRRLAEGCSVEDIPGIWYRSEMGVFRNGPTCVIDDFDFIPAPDYDLEDNYILVSKSRLVPLNQDNIEQFMGLTYWTMYSRGCPYSCTYCCNDALRKIYKGLVRMRHKSPTVAIEEVKAILRKFPFIRYISYQDDTFFALSEKAIEEFCACYTASVKLPFLIPGMHPSVFSEKKFDMLVAAGLLRTRMGIQTGSQRILKQIYGRNQNNEAVIAISKIVRKYSKKLSLTNYDIILDNPWESDEDILMTIDLLSKLAPPFSLNVFSLEFFPGTRLYEKAVRENIITEGGTTYKDYFVYQPTYLNLIVALFAAFTVPRWLLQLLLSKRLITTKRRFPIAHRILHKLMLYRRAIVYIMKHDLAMLPPAIQLALRNIIKPSETGH